MTLYQDIANKITEHIHQGVFLTGTRLPGVRRLSQQFGVSVSTIVQAQRQLENAGVLEVRPRSGYYISQRLRIKPDLPAPSQPEIKPMPVTGQELVLQLARAANQSHIVQLGAAVPSVDFMPMRAFQRSLSKTVRHYGYRAANYAFPPGFPELQQQIARRMYITGCTIRPEQVLITNGCQEALWIALKMVAQAGDIIALESPTFYGLLQVIEALGMKALEIPTDPQTGISLPALSLALEQWPVKACVLTPNFSNPLGSVMPDTHKQQLVKLAKQHNIILIEDDVYGDLGFNGEHPRSLTSFDTDAPNGHTIYCSSFSKTIAQGIRLGWMILPERYFQQAEYLKYVSSLAAPSLPQLALADFLAYGGYERYLRQIQGRYAQQINLFTQAISHYFSPATCVTQPKGGFVLWVDIAGEVDALHLTQQALYQRISIAPGQIFSATQKYRNCIRLNCAQVWTSEVEQAMQLLGKLARLQ